MKKITLYITLMILPLISTIGITPTFAAGIDCGDANIPAAVKNAAGCTSSGDTLPKKIVNILNAIIGAAGLVAVIFVIIGGIQYMTSSGDSAKVKKGKDTILYACIGLIICVLAFAIVNFVITKILKISP